MCLQYLLTLLRFIKSQSYEFFTQPLLKALLTVVVRYLLLASLFKCSNK
jgi:hypothetical protein